MKIAYVFRVGKPHEIVAKISGNSLKNKEKTVEKFLEKSFVRNFHEENFENISGGKLKNS